MQEAAKMQCEQSRVIRKHWSYQTRNVASINWPLYRQDPQCKGSFLEIRETQDYTIIYVQQENTCRNPTFLKVRDIF